MIFRFQIFFKVLTFDEFYLEIRPSDFRLLCTKKLQIFFSIFMYLSRFLKPTFLLFASQLSLKSLPLMNFISRSVHWIFDLFTPLNCKFFSLFLCIFQDFLYSPWSEREIWLFLRITVSPKPKRTHPPKLAYMYVTSMSTCINFFGQFRSIKFFDDHGLCRKGKFSRF